MKRPCHAPSFWFGSRSLMSAALSPIAEIYGRIAAHRMEKPGRRVPVPVICVGNFTLGGGGKTPLAVALAQLLIQMGERPVFLTRGYGGSDKGPCLVEAGMTSSRVGDEALLLARQAPTVAGADRLRGAEMAVAQGASVILMDDGFQNPTLAKDCSLLAVDGASGIGNGRVFPAGPLRAPLARQLPFASAIVVIGSGEAGLRVAKAAPSSLPVFHARLAPDCPSGLLQGRRVLAFAGIARPDKFFITLAELGAVIADRAIFPDHHPYTERDANRLLQKAAAADLLLVTTLKDQTRLGGGPRRRALREQAMAVPVRLVFENESAVAALIAHYLRA